MEKNRWWLAIPFALGVIFAADLSISACTCPGVNPSLYPPNISSTKKYYLKDFKGAAFIGKVVSSKESQETFLNREEKILEISVDVDKFWIGTVQRNMTIYVPASAWSCGVIFIPDERYFFIPTFEKNKLFIGHCTYALYSSKPDSNFVSLMTEMFGAGKKPARVR